MKKSDGIIFEIWFDALSMFVLEETGIDFTDEDSVLEDYDNDKDAFDVAQEISETRLVIIKNVKTI